MSFEQIKPTRIADQIAFQIEEQLAKGILKPGEKLPSERELSKMLKVSRPSVREALHKLEAREILKKAPGCSTYVSDTLNSMLTNPLQGLLNNNPNAIFELFEIRYALEGISAHSAAEQSTDSDKQVIKDRFEQLLSHQRQKIDENATTEAYTEFHLAIAEASHNVMLLHMMRGLFSVLHKSFSLSYITLYYKSKALPSLPDQQQVVMEAILAGEAEIARKAMMEHIKSVEQLLREAPGEVLQESVEKDSLALA